MKNLQRIILWKCYLAVFFIASPASLQAQTTHTGDLAITSDGTLPGNETTLMRITGNLNISGTITSFPDFAALEVVGGNLTIIGLTDTKLIDIAGIFPLLEEVGGDLLIHGNNKVETIAGFVSLREVYGRVSFGTDQIDGNANLTASPALNALRNIGEHLIINFNASLTDLPVLSALTSVGENLVISLNGAADRYSCFKCA